MRSTLRSLLATLATVIITSAFAQQPYTIMLSGTMTPCVPGTLVNIQTIQGTIPVINIDVPLDANCGYSAVLNVGSIESYVQVFASCGGGVASYGWDSAQFNFFLDTAYMVIDLTCFGGTYDCMGVLNGPDQPGTPCDDGDPLTTNDTWTWACDCVGSGPIYDCLGVLNGPDVPGAPCDDGDTLTTNDLWNAWCVCVGDTGNFFPFDCLGILNGPNMPGTPCDDGDPNTVQDTWSANCDCIGFTQNWYDCLGILNGPNVPGTACVDSVGGVLLTGIWDPNCTCVTNGFVDCLGVPNGLALPGTPCIVPGTQLPGTWDASCICVPDTNFFPFDCLGILNGPNMPGTPCDDGDPLTVNDTWTANCDCIGYINSPCQADFWVIQAYTIDSLNGGGAVPIPYELWLWNLSTGGSGNYSFFWDFGDGDTSTDPFPTHTYAGNGPYNLCLTIDDGLGCTSTYCDSVSVDQNGIYNGIAGGNGERSGFTINVQHSDPAGIHELPAFDGLNIWPNPATEELNLTVNSSFAGSTNLMIYDMNGRIVWSETRAMASGHNSAIIRLEGIDAGMYVIRIGDAATAIGRRFVKR